MLRAAVGDGRQTRPKSLLVSVSPCLLVPLSLFLAGCAERAAPEPPALQFEVDVAAGLTTKPQDGRLLILLSRKPKPEPRLAIDPEDENTPVVLGRDVKGLAAGATAVVGSARRHVPV